MALFDQFVKQGVQTPDTLDGSPVVADQHLVRAEVIYHFTSVNLYMLKATEGTLINKDQTFLGCDMTSMSPYGGGTSGGQYILPGTTVFVLDTPLTSMVSNSIRSNVVPIVGVDNGNPAPDIFYYPLFRLLAIEKAKDFFGTNIDEAIAGQQSLTDKLTDRLRGKPYDLNPGDWYVGNPLKGSMYVGGGRIGVEASPIAGMHFYTMGDTVVFNKGTTYIEDQPWRRSFTTLEDDGHSLKVETTADSTEEALGKEYGEMGAFNPPPNEELNVPTGTEVNLNVTKPLWGDLVYSGYSVSGNILQRVVKSNKNGVVQPGAFSFKGIDGMRFEGGAHSFTLSRTSNLPYIEMTRELDSEEPPEDNSFTPEDDVTLEDMGDYASQYADLMYELMKRKFVERYWAKQKANNKDWKAMSMSDVADQMGRTIDKPISQLSDDEPAYKTLTEKLPDPITEKETLVSQLESYIHLSPTGAIIISDGTGSEIRMEGGHIILSPAVDLRLQPGRDMSATVPRFASVFSGKRLDLASDTDEVAIHADKNITVSSEELVTIESRDRTPVSSGDPTKRGQGGGIVIRSASDTTILGHSIRLSLQNPTDDSKTGQKNVSDGMLILDASDSPIYMAGGNFTSHSKQLALLVDTTAGLTLSKGSLAIAASTQEFFGTSFIYGDSKFTATWKNPRDNKENTVSFTPATAKDDSKPSLVINGNVIASNGINAQQISGSRAVFEALSAMSGRETESIYVPKDMRSKYLKALQVYNKISGGHDFNFNYSTDITSWLTANTNNPAINAYGSKQLGIYYPSTTDYKQSNGFWVTSRWQRLLSGGTTWEPKNILDVDKKPMLPYPGVEGWTSKNFAVTWDNDGTVSSGPLKDNWKINCQNK